MTYQHSAAHLPGCHWTAGPSRPQCRLRPTVTVLTCLRSETLSPLARPQGRLLTVSAQANCHGVGLSLLPLYDSLTPGPRWAAGPGAHSVGQGLTVTAEPIPEPHSPSVSPAYRVGCPQFGSSNFFDVRRPPLRVVLLPRARRAAPTLSAKGLL